MAAYYNEIDPYCCRVLRKQIAAGNLPDGFVDERDIRDVRAGDLAGFHQIHLFAGIGGIPLGFRRAGMPDDFGIMSGGFPCQDISNAGKRAGIGGERSGLWSEYLRLIRAVRPDYVLVENVAALLVRGLDRVLGALAEMGYDAEWGCVPAAAVGAPYVRDRIFVLARDPGDGRRAGRAWGSPGIAPRLRQPARGKDPHAVPGEGWWAVEPRMERLVHGVPAGMDRLRGLGNAVVPQVSQWVAERILEHDRTLQ